MSLDIRVSDLIKGIYSAGADRSAWDRVVVELFQLMGCCGGIATLIDERHSELLLCRLYAPNRSTPTASADEYVANYRNDPALVWRYDNPDARFCHSELMLPRTPDGIHPFVQWMSSTLGSASWYAGYATLTPSLTFCLVGHFPPGRPEPDQDALKLFELVFDHVECALRLGARRFNEESARALIRLNSAGRVERLSRGADRMLSDRPAFRLCDGKLIASNLSEQATLDRTVERVLNGGAIGATPAAIQLEHEHGRPWVVVVRPVTENFGLLGTLRRSVEVEILDQAQAAGRLDVIQSLFELTGRELQVLRLLGQGHSIDSLSAMIEISRNTTRAHLRSIFSKTRTNSQTELLQLCGSLSNVAAPDWQSADLAAVN